MTELTELPSNIIVFQAARARLLNKRLLERKKQDEIRNANTRVLLNAGLIQYNSSGQLRPTRKD